MMRTWTVTTRSGYVVQPGSLTVAYLSNADQRTPERDRFILTEILPEPTPANPWNRCSGSSTTD
jgi:hypothetical protein